MTAIDIFKIVQENSGIITIILIVVASVLEISKIRINPWSWVGRMFNKDVIHKVEKIERDVADVKK